jgi:hypothetical protein
MVCLTTLERDRSRKNHRDTMHVLSASMRYFHNKEKRSDPSILK